MNPERKNREGIQFVITLQPILAEERISQLSITIKFVEKLFVKKQQKSCIGDVPIPQQQQQQQQPEQPKPKWQHELKYNRLLPYYDQLTKEADRHLAAIKAGLGYTLLLRNFVALGRWLDELYEYIKLNGYRFTKEDHILFVKIVYQLFSDPNNDLIRRVKIGRFYLNKLLEKPALLNRSDIEFDWRPFYELYQRINYKKLKERRLLLISHDLEENFEILIVRCRMYFPMSAVQEIVEEFRPFMLPGDTFFSQAIKCLTLFLPINIPTIYYNDYLKTWFHECLYWFKQSDSTDTDNIFDLLSYLPCGSRFWMDLDTLLPQIFTQLFRNFDLPLSGRSSENININNFSSLIGKFWSDDNKVQDHLRRLFESLHSYIYPSNIGPWQYNILQFAVIATYTFCTVVHVRRYHKPSWDIAGPEFNVTDKQIDDFVTSILPCVLNGMFDTEHAGLAVESLHYMSNLSPDIVIPEVIKKLFDALENSLEPHRLMQSLKAVTAVLCHILRDSSDNSSRKHVIPLMVGLLPAFDINDIDKCAQAGYTLSLFFLLVPAVDCSKTVTLRSDLTAEEKDICIETAVFESFIRQFMDKIFLIAETLGSAIGTDPNSEASDDETVIMRTIYFCTRCLFANCSIELYKLAVDKLYDFVETNLFERTIAADFLGQICANAIIVRPRQTFSRFLNRIIKKLKHHITDDLYIDENAGCLDVVWYLRLLYRIFYCDGDILLTEKQSILNLFNLLIGMKSKRISDELADLIFAVLDRLTGLYISERIDETNFILDQPLHSYVPVRLWAKTCPLDETNFQWHKMNDDEFTMVKEIADVFLFQQLSKFEQPDDLSKEDMLKSLIFINYCIHSMASVMPPLTGKSLNVNGNDFGDFLDFRCIASVNNKSFNVDGQNLRNFIAEKIHLIMNYIISSRNSEPKCLSKICSIYLNLIAHKGVNEGFARSKQDSAETTALYITDKVIGQRSYIKYLHMEKTMTQHQKRLMGNRGDIFNESHKSIMDDLLILSTSHYAEVRIEAQFAFDRVLNAFTFTNRLFYDDILALLKNDPNITDDQRKGALHLLIGSDDFSFITDDWQYWYKVWPTLIEAQHCEKQSIVELLEYVRLGVIDKIDTISITFKFSKEVVELGKCLWNKSTELSVEPLKIMPNEHEQNEAVDLERKRNENDIAKYYELVDILVNLCNKKTMHWRHLNMANGFLLQMIRMDLRFPAEAIQIYVSLLLHDNIYMRRQAFMALSSNLILLKGKTCKSIVDVEEVENISKSNGCSTKLCLVTDQWPLKWGYRCDNEWLIYRHENAPNSEELWNKFVFVDKSYSGFYCWPKKVKIYLPANNQSSIVNKTEETLTAEEIPLFKAFSDKLFVQQFCKLMTLDGYHDGEDDDNNDEADEDTLDECFTSYELLFFEYLFRVYNNMFLDNFKEYIENCVRSKTIKAEQRFASIFILGLVKGSKHWAFAKLEQLWSWLGPLIHSALEIILPDSLKYWTDCIKNIFFDKDPNRVYWLMEILLNLIKKPTDSPAIISNRIKLVLECTGQLQWKAVEFNEILLNAIKPLLIQPYENLRQDLGHCLARIFAYNFPDITRESKMKPPDLNEFMNEIWDKLLSLREECDSGRPETNGDDSHRNDAILLFKTMLCFFRVRRIVAFLKIQPLISLRFLPLLSYCQNETDDEQLKFDCQHELINGIGRTILDDVQIYEVLNACVEWSNTIWWKSRISLLQFLQVSVLSNMFSYQIPAHQTTVRQLVLKFLTDDQLEVREVAMETLTCFLHFHYLPTDDSLVKFFQQWLSDSSQIVKHGGVLGLAAIVNSCPYTVPNTLPDVLMALCQQKSASQIIKRTVEKTLLDFKRTHQDSWHEHKERFTDDQLFVLTELLVSPTYYV